jgi:TRAP-type C4-dicarboxylate transport system permease small subunit
MTELMHGRLRFATEIFNRLVILAVACCMIYFGFVNVLNGFGNFRMPSMTPIASYYAAIPLSGVMIALFVIEQLVNGWRNGFEDDASEDPALKQVT